MTRPIFENTYNAGQLLQFAGIAIQAVIVIAAIIGFWIGLSGRLSNVEKGIASVTVLVSDLQNTKLDVRTNTISLRQSETVLRDMTQTMKAVLEQLTEIREDVAALKAREGIVTK